MAEKPEYNGWYLALGTIIILGGVAFSTYFIRLVYVQFFPSSGVVSLSAYFVDESGKFVPQTSSALGSAHLKVMGSVSVNGEPISGIARITVSSAQYSKQAYFRQSVSVPVQKGLFETDDPAFRTIRAGQPTQIDVDVTAPRTNARSSIVLNTRPPADRTVWEATLIGVCLLLGVVFLWAFTGKKTAAKNQTAIIFSYVVIALFLAVPIVAPNLLLRLFPESVEGMIGAPAGFVNTHTANEDAGKTQWALNIGGYSFLPPKTASTIAQPPAGNTAAASSAPSDVQPTPETTANPPADSGAETTQPAVNSDTASRYGQSTAGAQDAPIVEVQGGLVIPLYVIILSVIGGAINMTRKVPRFQQEGEASEPTSDGGIRDLILTAGQALMGGPRAGTVPSGMEAEAETAERNPSPEQEAQAIQDLLDPLVTDQVRRNCQTEATLNEITRLMAQMQDLFKRSDADTLLGFGSFEDWAASNPRVGQLLHSGWRTELLNQYMYLISAPFLAVVTYYILDLLGLSKQGVVVVLSFSVGLISEKIVSWILGIATGYMRTDAPGTTPAKG